MARSGARPLRDPSALPRPAPRGARLAPPILLVLDAAQHAAVAERFAGRVPPERLRLHLIATDDAWCRDHGAIFVFDPDDALVALDFRFNAWGEKYLPFDRDDAAAGRMANALGVPAVPVDRVLEGGSIDVNGAGTVLTTEPCLLNPNRNPGMTRHVIEAMLGRHLGATQVLWLGEGIVGDDTDGHVDDLTRFVAEDTVITVVEPDARDPNHRPLADNRERLQGMRLSDVGSCFSSGLRQPGWAGVGR